MTRGDVSWNFQRGDDGVYREQPRPPAYANHGMMKMIARQVVFAADFNHVAGNAIREDAEEWEVFDGPCEEQR